MGIVAPGIVGRDIPTAPRIRSPTDFPAPVGGVITLTEPTYELENSITMDDGIRFVYDQASGVSSRACIRALGRHIKLTGSVDGADAFVTFMDQGVISQIDIVNNGTGAVVEAQAATNNAADSGANFMDLLDCSLTSPSAVPAASTAVLRVLGDNSGRFPPRLRINNANLGSFASDGTLFFTDGAADFIDLIGALMPNPVGPSLRLSSTFDGFNFGGTVENGTLGAVVANPAITVDVGATIVSPSSTRPLLVQGVNVAGTLSGFDTADAQVLFLANQGVRNSLFVGDAAFSANATDTVISTQSVFEPIVGTLVAGPEQERVTLAGNVFTYTDSGYATERDARVVWSASIEGAGGANIFYIRVEHQPGGAGGWNAIANSAIPADGTNRLGNMGGTASFPIAPGDEVRLTIANDDNTTNVLVHTLQVRMDIM